MVINITLLRYVSIEFNLGKMTEDKMMLKFFKERIKLCKKEIKVNKNKKYWKGQKKAFERSLIEFKLYIRDK